MQVGEVDLVDLFWLIARGAKIAEQFTGLRAQ
jgi:hypothetical protein